jgi:hypothetical protein
MDRNGDSVITVEDLAAVMRAIGQSPTLNELQEEPSIITLLQDDRLLIEGLVPGRKDSVEQFGKIGNSFPRPLGSIRERHTDS